jgi:alkylation response protein AidB-like acyl-CoA dehydrogenase
VTVDELLNLVTAEVAAAEASVDGQAARTVAPLAEHVDRAQTFSPELWAAVRDIGLTRLPFPERYGGEGGTVRAYVVATGGVARHCPVAALYPGTSIQVAMTLLDHSTPEQIERYVPGLVAGTSIEAVATVDLNRLVAVSTHRLACFFVAWVP